jgi:hypothetical protein
MNAYAWVLHLYDDFAPLPKAIIYNVDRKSWQGQEKKRHFKMKTQLNIDSETANRSKSNH